MPETPEQFWERTHDQLQAPPVAEWETWPFDGPVQPKPLEPPVERERPRHGEGGVDCRACTLADDAYVWANERWRLRALDKPSGLPVVVLLEPRAHYSAPGDLPEELAAELGVLIGRIERAVRSVEGVGLVHVLRYGEGSDHLHIGSWHARREWSSCGAASRRSGTTCCLRRRTTCGARTSTSSSPRSAASRRPEAR